MGYWNTGLGSLQKWKIGNEIRTILLSNQDIINQVGNNVYPIIAPEGTDADFILYKRIQYSKLTVKQGVYEDRCELAVIAVCDNYDNSIDLASKIDNALTGKHLLENGYRLEIVLSDSTETYEDNKFIQTLTFTIK